MPGPLGNGHRLAQLDTNWVRSDPHVQVRSEGQRFADLKAAEAAARHLSKGEQGDAVVLRDRQGAFWVYRTDEFSKVASRSCSSMPRSPPPHRNPCAAHSATYNIG